MKSTFCGAVIMAVFISAAVTAQELAPGETDTAPDLHKVSYALGMREGLSLKHSDANLDFEVLTRAIKDVLEGKPTRMEQSEIADVLKNKRLDGLAKTTESNRPKVSYAVGMSIGLKLKQTGMDLDDNEVVRGLKDIIEARPTKLQEADFEPLFRQAQVYAQSQKASKNKIAGEAFLAKNAKEPGVTVLPDGLQYKVIQEGKGKMPTTEDLIMVRYRGTLVDGTEFDHHNGFLTRINGGIEGWQEALQKMKMGSRWEVCIPPQLAYGKRGEPFHKVGPDSTLIYDLEVLSIVQPGTAQMNSRLGRGLDHDVIIPNQAGSSAREVISDEQARGSAAAVKEAAIKQGIEQGHGEASSKLTWEADHIDSQPKPEDLTANISFNFTNVSDNEVVIDNVKSSCSCTVAKLPSEPWHLAAHTNGHIDVIVDLKGKQGEFSKTLTVFFGEKEVQPKLLVVKVKMPDRTGMRSKNMELAKADRQAVFKGDCAKCHAEPAKTATGMALYHEACGVCHEAIPRATMVPDLRAISQHPTDYAFWKTMIANGKPGTLMPAFAQNQGGPLTDDQIEKLARTIDEAFPYSRFATPPPQAAAAPGPQVQQQTSGVR